MPTAMGTPALLWIALLFSSPDGISADWLLLQASAEMVLEGEPLFLRCHGWRNLNVYKVTYFKNDKALKYWYENHNISITKATTGDSGTYYCMGIIQQILYTSNHLSIKIKKASRSKYFWLQFLIPLLVKILFVVDTALFISTQQQLTVLLKIKRTRKGNKFMDPQPRPEPPKS
ncbi:high affinity immunoglobulin epsilon receptor subunit alpha [Phocoena phocoena]|uniref:high affinity immunoglobulin epsilon receptor subunit alpha n=1 Tax=Phocoena phocoena TaxID=9742 RepID=UPI0033072791